MQGKWDGFLGLEACKLYENIIINSKILFRKLKIENFKINSK